MAKYMLDLEDKLLQKFKVLSAQQGKTMKQMITELIKQAVKGGKQ